MRVLIIILSMCFLCSCASIMKTDEERITVATNPAGATVTYGDKSSFSPCTLDLTRGKNYKFSISKEGYEPQEFKVSGKSWDGWLWGNLVFLVGFPVGVAIDFYQGYAYDFSPDEIDTDLKKQ